MGRMGPGIALAIASLLSLLLAAGVAQAITLICAKTDYRLLIIDNTRLELPNRQSTCCSVFVRSVQAE